MDPLDGIESSPSGFGAVGSRRPRRPPLWTFLGDSRWRILSLYHMRTETTVSALWELLEGTAVHLKEKTAKIARVAHGSGSRFDVVVQSDSFHRAEWAEWLEMHRKEVRRKVVMLVREPGAPMRSRTTPRTVARRRKKVALPLSNGRLRMASWNIAGMKSKIVDVQEFLETQRIDVCALQETNVKKGFSTSGPPGYRYFGAPWTPVGTCAGRGVAFLVKSDLVPFLSVEKWHGGRQIWATLRLPACRPVLLGCVHVGREERLSQFQAMRLNINRHKVETDNGTVVLLGDFNGRAALDTEVAQRVHDPNVPSALGTSDQRRRRQSVCAHMEKLMREFRLVCGPYDRSPASRRTQGTLASALDWILYSSDMMSNEIPMVELVDLDASDHAAVVMELHLGAGAGTALRTVREAGRAGHHVRHHTVNWTMVRKNRSALEKFASNRFAALMDDSDSSESGDELGDPLAGSDNEEWSESDTSETSTTSMTEQWRSVREDSEELLRDGIQSLATTPDAAQAPQPATSAFHRSLGWKHAERLPTGVRRKAITLHGHEALSKRTHRAGSSPSPKRGQGPRQAGNGITRGPPWFNRDCRRARNFRILCFRHLCGALRRQAGRGKIARLKRRWHDARREGERVMAKARRESWSKFVKSTAEAFGSHHGQFWARLCAWGIVKRKAGSKPEPVQDPETGEMVAGARARQVWRNHFAYLARG